MLSYERALLGAGGAKSEPVYVEDVFSTWLYTGNGSTQTITNGIDLSGEGGLVWIKNRSATGAHTLVDTVRGATKYLMTNNTIGEQTEAQIVPSFSSNGFTTGSDNQVSVSPDLFASWTFRKAPKFFDVVTWTGDGTDGRQIAHNLGSTPGCVIIKRTDSSIGWAVYHRSRTTTYGELNSTNAFATSQLGGFNMQEVFGDSSTVILPDASNITVARFSPTNASGGTYVAYLFAHDAGGFGDSGDESVIKCGSFTTDGSGNATVDLGWEPQWVLIKKTNATGQSWLLLDSMRGTPLIGNSAYLSPNANSPEFADFGLLIKPNATGFTSTIVGESSSSYIYIAIRRGPMKTPTVGTEVFYPDAINTSAGQKRTTGFPVDWQILRNGRNLPVGNFGVTRLTGASTVNSDAAAPFLRTYATDGESNTALTRYWDNSGYKIASTSANTNAWFLNFRRAPGFFDVVAYTGTGSARTVAHNLGVAPEFIICRARSSGGYDWPCYHAARGNTETANLNQISLFNNITDYWNNTSPTSTVFSLSNYEANSSGVTYIAYLFATCPGVSKVGSYTGTSTTLNIDCGFTAGARFVLIKRADSSGNWYVYDSARGIVSGNDPYLLINSTAAEVTSTDYIDPLSSGFQISSAAPAAINASGGSFIFLAIA